MNIVRYRQWPGPRSMQEEFRQAIDRLFEGGRLDQGESDESSVVTSQWMPRVDIKEEKDRFLILADLPGVDADDVEVSMDNGILTIKGERRNEQGEQTDRFARIERSYGLFHRRFALPDSADPQGITAHTRNGVLEIAIPKRPEMAPRRISVGRHEASREEGKVTPH